jgi:hypothetical protein
MLKNLPKFLIVIVTALLFTSAVNAQAITVGGLAFTGYTKDGNGSGQDEFSFVLLQSLGASQQIFFTDLGWTDLNAFQNQPACPASSGSLTDGVIRWTSPASVLPRGTHVKIVCQSPASLSANIGAVVGITASINAPNDYMPLSPGGDQIFAFTGSTAAPTLIAGIDLSGAWEATLANCVTTSTQSRQPAALNTNNFSFVLTPEIDNGRLKQTVKLSNPANAATDRANIANSANWDFDDINYIPLPGNLFILPVNFTWIKASERSSNVQVDFGVGTEEQVAEYQIQRSADGRVYSTIGTIAASRQPGYSFSDIQPIAGNNFYRIKAVDLGGDTKFSTVVNINLSKSGKAGIAVYPSVVTSSRFTLQVTNLPAGSYKLNITSVTGQLIMSRVLNHTGGSATQTVNVPASIQKGIYKVSLTGAAEASVTAIIVQ